MFPLRDTVRSRTFPVVNTTIIVINILVFLYEFALGRHLDAFIKFGLTPVRFFWGIQNDLRDAIIPVFTAMFLHGGWLHVLGNMWFLYIFGDNVEDRVGHGRYIFYYLLCGIARGFRKRSFSKIPRSRWLVQAAQLPEFWAATFYYFRTHAC